MSTSTTPDGEQPKTTETAVEVTQQFLNTTSDYFQSEMKCMFIRKRKAIDMNLFEVCHTFPDHRLT